ncbi:MAG TPA: lipopolysaccharide transport periplasmic protein LptA [Gammaproteobacteria bacterium]|nr:lipopolysaccharide transport periplasmic protein LptA [Gammaproteobacteria bacterium]
MAAALLLAAVPGCAFALSSDRQKPFHLEADRAQIDHKTGVSVYRGNVQVSRGSMHLTGDTVTVYTDSDDHVNKVVAVGSPATFRQRPDHKEQDVKGRAQRVEYFAAEDRVVLLDKARVWQAGNTCRSDRIVYQVGRDVVNAGAGEGTGKARVHITLPAKGNSAGGQ